MSALARRVSQQDRARAAVALGDQDRGRPGPVGGSQVVFEAIDAVVVEEGLVAGPDGLAAVDALGAAPGHDLCVLEFPGGDPALFGGADDHLGERVVRARFRGRPESEHLFLGVARGHQDIDDLELAGGQRAGLVKHDGVDLGGRLDDLPSAGQQAAAGQAADGGNHGGGSGQDQCAGAPDDQDRHGPAHALGGLDVAGEEIDRAGSQQDGGQKVAGVAVRFPHHRRGAVVAGLFDQVNEPR